MKINFKQQNRLVKEKDIILFFVILMSLLISGTFINAQTVQVVQDFKKEQITKSYEVKEFTVTEINNIAYFRFVILEKRLIIEYTLEESSNGENFETVKTKEGFLSPNNQPLLYCYKLNTNKKSNNYYRIKMVTADGANYSTKLLIKSTSAYLTTKQSN